MQSVLDLDSGCQRSCSGIVTLLWGQSPGTVHWSNLRFFVVSEDSQISGLLHVLGLLFFFLIYIYLAVFGLMGSVVVACRLSCHTALGILIPSPGIEPASPALQGEFLTTGPPGKPSLGFSACKTHSSFFQILIFFTSGYISQLIRWFATRFSVVILRISNVDVLKSTEGSTSRKTFFLSHYMYLLGTYSMNHQPALSFKKLVYAEKATTRNRKRMK